MLIQVWDTQAFISAQGGGNPAGVVLNADCISEKDMQTIARIVGYSETAFVMKSDRADVKVRFFTPTEEVDLCGHATIAAFSVMAFRSLLSPGSYQQETKAGILGVEIGPTGDVLMEQLCPTYYDILSKEKIASTLGIGTDDLSDTLPVEIVSTGLKDIMVPLKNLAVMGRLQPNFNKIAEVSQEYGVTGYHIFSLETLHQGTAHCRNMAPLVGIPEEAATGTSNGALGSYLYKYGKVSATAVVDMRMEQGYFMNAPSEIAVRITGENSEILKVQVGGRAAEPVCRLADVGAGKFNER